MKDQKAIDRGHKVKVVNGITHPLGEGTITNLGTINSGAYVDRLFGRCIYNYLIVGKRGYVSEKDITEIL